MTYKINGTDIALQPTSGKWITRSNLGYDGNGHPIYAPKRKFELRWGLISQEDRNQLQLFFDAVAVTGTAVVDLPEYRSTSYIFYSYSGCVINEPDIDEYFESYSTDMILLVTNIRTE